MDPMVVFSPHLDDAALSAGQYIGAYPNTYVVTVFAGVPSDPNATTTYDRNCGFATAAESLSRREIEDREAMRVLDAQAIRLGFVDWQYGPTDNPDDNWARIQSLMVGIELVLTEIEPTHVIGPLGLAHPDHEFVADALLRVMQTRAQRLWLYEDLPSRVLWPEKVPEAKDRARSYAAADLELMMPGGVDVIRKRAAVACYASQSWGLDEHCYLVPERFWQVPM